ncbi:aromatic amino acid ammonia-lyase (plasmid) [Citricoccus nitrophenolicus]
METRLDQVTDYIRHHHLAPDWLLASSRIRHERTQIVNALQSTGKAVYGFTSMLGQLDTRVMATEEQDLVLQSHLVGVPEIISSPAVRAITGAKISQLAAGGSGISPEAWRALLSVAPHVGETLMDLNASYGAGDVVPAAWWATGVLPGQQWQAGDVIALINGNHVAVGISVLAYLDLERAVDRFGLLAGPEMVAPLEASSGRHAAALTGRMQSRPAWQELPQAPVSTRDGSPTARLVQNAMDVLGTELEHALSRPSGNPVFTVEGGTVGAHSQSSFLNPSLTSALVAAQHAVAHLAAVTQRATEITAERVLAEPDATSTVRGVMAVQQPKVSEAYRQQIASHHSPMHLSGSMSGGVEDLWDNALLTARSVLRSLSLFDRQLDILESVGVGHAAQKIGPQPEDSLTA